MEKAKRPKSASDNSIVITGIVIPTDWDENLVPNQFALSAYDDQEYLIDTKNAKGKELVNFLRNKTRVTGKISGKVKSRKKIKVESFVLIEDSDR
jgi:hypothetical protein